MASGCLQVAALGRPLYVGMLYDCRTDSFIPGVTLWDKQSIKKDLDVHLQQKTNLKFSSSDTLSDKANLLDISASLKGSFLGGLVEVSGSAKYMRDTKSSEHQCRVTMQYNQTTKFEQLTMEELGKIIYPQVFDHKTATHVITGVLYGAQAFMLFDYMTSDEENKDEVTGTLRVLVTKIPGLSIEGEGKLDLNESEKKLATNMSVNFYGDYELEENPTSFLEAVQTYKQLPSLLKKTQSDGVPQVVWLYPLKLLDDKAAQLMREITASLISKTENVLDELGQLERRCNDFLSDSRLKDYPDPKVRVQTFNTLQSDYKIELQKKLSSVLPAIRGGTQEEKALSDILTAHINSPFASQLTDMWLDDSTTELKVLGSYTKDLQDITTVTSLSSLNSVLFDPAFYVVVCLSFTSLDYKDPYLEDLQKYLNSEMFNEMQGSVLKPYSRQPAQRWFNSLEISKRMRQNLSLFLSFSKGNANDKGMKFIIASISDSDNPGSSIRLYQQGCLTDPKFVPVSKPPPPTAETKGETINLKLQKSPTGETIRFRVEYKVADRNDPEKPWEFTDTPDVQINFSLTGLQIWSQYLIRYKAISEVGMSEASDPVCVHFNEFDVATCVMVGGTDTKEESILFPEATLKSISVYAYNIWVIYLKVEFSNGKVKEFGSPVTSGFTTFTFQDGEHFQSLRLYTSGTGKLCGIEFDVESKYSPKRSYSNVASYVKCVPVDVGSGICCGVKVKSDVYVDSLGFYFLKNE